MKISALFNALGKFLNDAVDYFDERIKTGKFVDDIKFLSKKVLYNTETSLTTTSKTVSHSSFAHKVIDKIKVIYQSLIRLPVVGAPFQILLESIKINFLFYADIFITFALTFPTAILLINFFETSIELFFITFIPILIFCTYCYSALFLCIQKKSTGQHETTLFGCYMILWRKLPSLLFLVFLQLAVFIELTLGYVILAFFYSYLFNAIGVSWSGSFFYWFFVVFLGLLFALILFIFNIVCHQTYFIILLEGKKIQTALKAAWQIFNKNQLTFIICYLFLTGSMLTQLYYSTLFYLYIGLGISLYVLVQTNTFLGFLLYKNYYRKELYLTQAESAITPFEYILVFFGIANYLLVGLLTIKHFNKIDNYLQTQRNNYFFMQELKTYSNKLYQYTIEYPQRWTVYEWRPNTVTIYNNYTGTIAGGIWLTIDIMPYNEDSFLPYYEADTGLLKTNADDMYATYKISNISIQGYKGVTYTQDKKIKDSPEFQTNYLIRKRDLLYKITFTSKSKNIEGYNYETIEKIINSFRFIEK